jgi:hypothetical protein
MGLMPERRFEMNAKKLIFHILAAMAIAVLASACIQEDVPGDETAAELKAAILPEQSDELAAIEGAEQAMSFDEGQPGEALDESATDDADVTANCVYVEWCNKPGPSNAAVCRLRPGCKCSDAAWDECYADLDALDCESWSWMEIPGC